MRSPNIHGRPFSALADPFRRGVSAERNRAGTVCDGRRQHGVADCRRPGCSVNGRESVRRWPLRRTLPNRQAFGEDVLRWLLSVGVESMARVRLADIAKKAGVSEASVSRVLNDRQGVSHKMRQAVLDALHEAGAQTDRSVRDTSRIIALVTTELMSMPVVAALVQELEQAVRRYGYVPAVYVQPSDAVLAHESFDLLIEHGAAGAVFVSGWPDTTVFSEDTLAELRGQGLPYVFVNGRDMLGNAPSVSVDNRAAVRLATRHLNELGHARIGMVVGNRQRPSSASSIDGFIDALEEVRRPDAVPEAHRVYHTLPTVAGGRVVVGTLLEDGCTGVLCDSDLTALGIMQALHERGLSVPEHVSVVTFTDSQFMEFIKPPLTAVRQPVRAIAMAAVATLLSNGGTNGPHNDGFLLMPELIVRGSTSARCPTPEALSAQEQGA
ncbi:LacI family DNA-binding transcriptional regulator [Streptomyces sp. NPDC057620]|uniref:LacI family DNA-binding transcriptional regulator n=1 Tax=Streptomyces sp. NPDC057620 TaxID=3346185 RepID=UPI0036BBFF9A